MAMAQGRSPLDKTLFVGYYEGEYDKDGALLHPDICDKDGNLFEEARPLPVLVHADLLSAPGSNQPMTGRT